MVPRSISGTPKRRQNTPKVASSATTRMSAHNASSMPPATQKPSPAAITGFVSRSRPGPIGAIEPWPPISRFLLGSPDATALRSAPAQKVPPVPVNTATEACASASNARNASNSFRAVEPSTALRQCGRLMETMVTGPSRSTSTVSGSDMVALSLLSLFVIPGRCEASNPESRDSGSGPLDHPGMTWLAWLNRKFAPRDPPIGFEIAFAGGLHDAWGQGRGRRIAVPAAGAALDVEIIAQRLLVETRLRLAGRVDIRRPEPRTVGGHHLVDQDDMAVLVAAEFEFGVGDDDALVAAEFFTERIDGPRHAFQRVGDLIAEDLAHPRNRDVLVVTGFGLGRRAEDRGLEFRAFDKAGREFLAGERAVGGVFLPRRARQIAADHAFDRKYRGAPAQHRASGKRSAMALQRGHLADDLIGVGADHVVMDHALELVEPPGADLGQHRAFHRDGFGHDNVEGADAVGGGQQPAVAACVVDIADLAAPDPGKRQVAGEHGGHRSTFESGVDPACGGGGG